MIRITIGNKKYRGVYSWDDITLRQYCDLAAIPIPEGYKEFIIADGKFSSDNQSSIDSYIEATEKITDEQLNEMFPAYYRKVISCLSDIPEGLKLTTDHIHDIYELYLKPFVVSLIYHAPLIYFAGELKDYTPVIKNHFDIGFQRFYLPRTISVMDQKIPLADEPIVSYTEASDIFRGMKLSADDIHKLAMFMAIYCRKKNEWYDERRVIERKELFMSARMSVVWGVFFCIIRQLPAYMTFTLLFGGLPKSIRDSVSEVRTYRSMAVVD